MNSEIINSRRAAEFFRSRMKGIDVEEFWAMALTPTCKVIEAAMLFRGTVDTCFVHPRDIFRFAIQHNATSIIVAHNHHSGSPYPSLHDFNLTQKLRAAGEVMCVPLVDHVLVTETEHFSFAEKIWTRKKMGRTTRGSPKVHGQQRFFLGE